MVGFIAESIFFQVLSLLKKVNKGVQKIWEVIWCWLLVIWLENFVVNDSMIDFYDEDDL